MKADRVTERRKLIEVALPLEAINREAAREKSIRHGHPSTLHLWWSRKPLAAARAVLFAQLVDDPASRPEAEAIADDDERADWISSERARLFRLIEELILWDNSTNLEVLARAHDEIVRSADGAVPTILDPFAGGGSIPLEAQRMGLNVRASDLNPVAVMINKAVSELPPKFANVPPVFPGAADSRLSWAGVSGLAEDVRRYGEWMREEAERRLEHLYPLALLRDGTAGRVIAWIWARTVECANPLCRIQMPLVSKWWLGKKKGKEAYISPVVADGKVSYTIESSGSGPKLHPQGTISRSGGICVACGSVAPMEYIRSEALAGRLGSQMMAVAVEGVRRRIYIAPTQEHLDAAALAPLGISLGRIALNARWFSTPQYGMTDFADLFSNRQLLAMTTFCDLVTVVRERAQLDASRAASSECWPTVVDAGSYADAIATYLGLAVSRFANYSNSLCRWRPDPSKEQVNDMFAQQAIPMIWDYAEANVFSHSAGGWTKSFEFIPKAIERLPAFGSAHVQQCDARSAIGPSVLSTDPPYYDNIGYSDISDFFYPWLRRSLRGIYPEFLSTMQVPKAEELVANPVRHGSKANARRHFRAGFEDVFRRAADNAVPGYPATVYYAFKQADAEEGDDTGTGWETFLEGMIAAEWRVTATWPIRSELTNRMAGQGANSLASSIVLALRPRPSDARTIDRRGFTADLRDALPKKLRELQQGSIAPVDLAQAAVGPGMAVFSKYSKVVEADGSCMTVRSALRAINQVLGEVLSSQEGDFDSATRWCLKWFESNGFNGGRFGEAETLASAYNTSVKGLERSGALAATGGVVTLFSPEQLPAEYDARTDDHITLWEVVLHVAKALDETGLDAAGRVMARASTRIDLDAAKELAYLVFSIATEKKWSDTAQLFNLLAASWADVVDAARRSTDDQAEQLTLESTY